MANLLPRSVEVDGLLMGPSTPYAMTKILAGGKPDTETQDRPRPREDSVAFGLDKLTGRLLKLELTIDTDSYLAAQRAWAELSTVWDAERIRKTPAAVVPLRVRQFDGATRWVVGRPNRIDPVDEELLPHGRLDVVLDFRCIDHLFYSDLEKSATVGIVPASSGGLVAPLTDPLTTVGRSEGAGSMTVEGDVATWVSLMFRGPIASAAADITSQWRTELTTQLFASEYVLLNSSPWERMVRRNGKDNISGELTHASPYLSEMRIAPGTHDIRLQGIDDTGTASLTASWRDAFTTL